MFRGRFFFFFFSFGFFCAEVWSSMFRDAARWVADEKND